MFVCFDFPPLNNSLGYHAIETCKKITPKSTKHTFINGCVMNAYNMCMPTPCRPTETIWLKSSAEATGQTNAQDASTECIKTIWMHKTIFSLSLCSYGVKTMLTLRYVFFCSFADYLFIGTKRYWLIGTCLMLLNKLSISNVSSHTYMSRSCEGLVWHRLTIITASM